MTDRVFAARTFEPDPPAVVVVREGLPGGPVLTVRGDLAYGTSDTFAAACDRLTRSVPPGERLTLDLTGVGFLDSSGMAPIYAAAKSLTDAGLPLGSVLVRVARGRQPAKVLLASRSDRIVALELTDAAASDAITQEQ